jgi:hypothetical protein
VYAHSHRDRRNAEAMMLRALASRDRVELVTLSITCIRAEAPSVRDSVTPPRQGLAVWPITDITDQAITDDRSGNHRRR